MKYAPNKQLAITASAISSRQGLLAVSAPTSPTLSFPHPLCLVLLPMPPITRFAGFRVWKTFAHNKTSCPSEVSIRRISSVCDPTTTNCWLIICLFVRQFFNVKVHAKIVIICNELDHGW